MAIIVSFDPNGDFLVGTDEDDFIGGEAGDDTLIGQAGDDIIAGFGGNDVILGQDDHDDIGGDEGNDVLFGGTGNDLLAGNDGNDRLAVEVRLSNFGIDVLTGDAGFDTIAFETGSAIEVNGNPSQVVVQPASRGVVVNLIDAITPGRVSDFGQTGLDSDGEVVVDDTARVRGQILDRESLGSGFFGPDGVLDVLDAESAVFADVEKFELTAFADLFLDSSANHIIEGGGGDDLISGGGGADIIDGGAGTDTALYRFSSIGVSISLLDVGDGGTGSSGEAANDKLFSIENVHGSDHDDIVIGGIDNNLIRGFAGNDSLFGLGGFDTLFGGDGDDDLFGGRDGDSLSGDGGADTLDGGSGQDFLDGGGDDDNLSGGLDGDFLFGGSGADTLDGGSGNDTLQGGSGSDTGVFTSWNAFDSLGFMRGTITLANASTPGSAALTRTIFGTPPLTFELERDSLSSIENVIGSDFNETITGNSSGNRLEGRGGNDVIEGGLSLDTLLGGDGNDRLIGGPGSNAELAPGVLIPDNDVLDGGAGTDTADYSGNLGTVLVTLGPDGTSGSTTEFGTIFPPSFDVLLSIENVIGSAFLDVLRGNGDDNVLSGLAGADILDGGAGNDTINGGGGSDTGVFTSWNTFLSLGQLIGSVIVGSITLADAGISGLAVLVQRNLAVPDVELERDSLSSIENVVGSDFDEVITGNRSGNRLEGRGGNDVIDGGLSLDTLLGGEGNDRLIGGPGSTAELTPGILVPDSDLLDGGDGRDTVDYSANVGTVLVTLGLDGAGGSTTEVGPFGPSFDVLHSIEIVLGSAHNDVIRGNGEANSLFGNSGNDTMTGGAGSDDVSGGDGDDSLLGEQGADLIAGGLGDDLLSGGGGPDRLLGGAGNDTLLGGPGADTLSGGLGNDVLKGGGSNDSYAFALGDGADRLVDAGGQADKLVVNSFADISQSVRVNDSLIVTFVDGGRVVVVNHFLAANRIENVADAGGNEVVLAAGAIGGNASGIISGTRESDFLFGRGGDDLLFGAAGHDVLMGGSGDDLLRGGRGDDTLLGGLGRDTLVLASGDGEDLLIDFVSGEDKIAFVRDTFGIAPAAAVSDVVALGAEAPDGGTAIHISAGTITFDSDWSDAAGREVLAHGLPEDPVLSDVILL